MSRPVRKTADLLKGRISLPGARYFLTCNVAQRAQSFENPSARRTVLSVIESLTADHDWEPINACVMPDHFHLLCVWTGNHSSVSKTLGKAKTLIRRNLGWKNLLWQDNFFEHRLRPEECVERYALYLFLNPFRSRLIEPGGTWDGYRC